MKVRWGGKAFDWKARATCLHLARFHLRSMGKRPPALPPIASLLAAKKALAERGWSGVFDWLDSLRLTRIAPAAALPGDLVGFASEDGLGSVAIYAAPGRVLGWHDDAPAFALVDFRADEATAVWRV